MVAQNTKQKARVKVEQPNPEFARPAKKQRTPVRECTMDKAVFALAEGHVLRNALLWDYAVKGSSEPPELTWAIDQITIHGDRRKERNVHDLVGRYWALHSKYIAPTCSEVHEIYTDILSHVVALFDRYGSLFMKPTSPQMKEFTERLAGECGAPDEEEKNRVEQYAILEEYGSFPEMVDAWVEELGNLPPREGDYKDRVNVEMCKNWYFRKGGVIDYSIKLITDFMETARHSVMTEDVIKYDNKDQGYKQFPSCILLGNECTMEDHTTTSLVGDWYMDKRVQALIKNAGENKQTRDAITALFVYSYVDPGQGLNAIRQEQEDAMNGRDKTDASYDNVVSNFARPTFPPWRTAGGEWPEESVMENINYQAVESTLDDAITVDKPRPKKRRFREDAEDAQPPPQKPPTSKKQKVTEPPAGETGAEPEETEEGPNYAMWGGLAAVTVGITAIALSGNRA